MQIGNTKSSSFCIAFLYFAGPEFVLESISVQKQIALFNGRLFVSFNQLLYLFGVLTAISLTIFKLSNSTAQTVVFLLQKICLLFV